MKLFLKKNYKAVLIIAFDILCVLAIPLCWLLTDAMLKAPPNPCPWTQPPLGGKCISCGGTHFVNYLTSFKIAEAFSENQLFFFLTIYFLITLIMFNLWWIFNLTFAKKALKIMYSIPAAIIFGHSLIAFMIWRNIPMFINIASIAKELVQRLTQ